MTRSKISIEVHGELSEAERMALEQAMSVRSFQRAQDTDSRPTTWSNTLGDRPTYLPKESA
jgi:hypothetical protein